jgi:hypothetical protein
VNIFLLLCGIGVSITTVNLTLFYYALFCKLVLLKIVITLVISAFTKEFHLNSFSLNVSTVIIIFILGGINFYHILPFVKVVLGQSLTNTTNMLNKIGLFIAETNVKVYNSENLATVNIYLTKFLITGNDLVEYIFYTIPHNYFEPVHCCSSNAWEKAFSK